MIRIREFLLKSLFPKMYQRVVRIYNCLWFIRVINKDLKRISEKYTPAYLDFISFPVYIRNLEELSNTISDLQWSLQKYE